MWTKISIAAVAVVAAAAALLAVAARRPPAYRVERSAFVAAPPGAILAELTDLHRWVAWSPRERLDPRMNRRYAGPRTGVGSTYYWSGEHGTGEGRLTVLAVRADGVDLEVEQQRPTRSASDLELRLAPEGAGTRVTWTVTGERGFTERLRGLLASPDRALGADVDAALAALRHAVEAPARAEVRRVERSTLVAATPAVVRAHVADLRRWTRWSPWEGLDAKVQRTYGGPRRGVGASYYWSGDEAVGRGRLTVLREGADGVELELELDEPRQSSSDMRFALAPEGAGTRITWTMTRERLVAGEAFGLSANAGGSEGEDLEKGLARLKSVAEAEAKLVGLEP